MASETARPSKKARGTAASGLTVFALRLAKHLADPDESATVGQNLVFSPLSIYAALALLAAGARGTTLDELLATLGATSRQEIAEFVSAVVERVLADANAAALADSDSDSNSGSGSDAEAGSGSSSRAPLLVAFACALWHQKTVGLKPAYRMAAVESYKAEIHAADFMKKPEESRENINKWVSKATKDLITEILPQGSVDPTTILVLANAIYFKGSWSIRFNKKDTENRRFQRLDGSHVATPFMRGRGYQAVEKYGKFKVLKLAYHPHSLPCWKDKYGGGRNSNTKKQEGPRFSMCVFLPNNHDGLSSLMDKMASCPSFLWDHMPSERVEIGELWLPKFKLSFSSKINGVLKALGIKAVFENGTADLSDMQEGRAGLEHVFHKAVIEVNEEGTEAAASTAATRKLQCARRTVDFVADHPFAFFVVEEVSGAVVFMGHILDPTESK